MSLRTAPTRLPSVVPIGLAVLLLTVGGCGTPEPSDPPASQSASVHVLEPEPTPIRRKPGLDILLITIDTLRADALGSYGNARASTPWIDRLAADGVRFENARAHNVNTLPSHATIFSGLYPQEHGVRDNSGFRFPANIETLATLLQAKGYRTGAFISAFPLDSQFGLARGFEVYDDGFLDAETQVAFQVQERPGSDTVARAKAWLDSDDDRPTLAWVHLFEPHFPYAPPPGLSGRFRDDPYSGDVAAADAALGPLLEPLLDRTRVSNTLVVLTSDHGEALGDHGEPTHGIFAYESTLRVPLILYQPDLLSARAVSEPARLVDLLPTILDLLGLETPTDLTGDSLVPTLFGNSNIQTSPTYFEALSARFNLGWAPLHGVIEDNWKYIDLPIPELYDLQNDPGEERNLAAREPDRIRRLRQTLRNLLETDEDSSPADESQDTQRRLQALGYLASRSGSGADIDPASFDEDDDPKRLIPLFRKLREVGGLYSAGDLTAARSLCREIVAQRPGMRVALMYLAQIERDLGDLAAAVETMREVFELKPGDSEALALLASYLMQAGKPSEAVQVTDAHSRLERPHAEVMLTRGLALARLRRPREAIATLRTVREVDPKNPMVPVYLGTIHLMAGDRQKARDAYEEALEIDPDTVRAHTALAIMATEEGLAAEALDHWRRAAEVDPRQYSRIFSIADRLWSAGQRPQARPLLELFAESAPPERFAREIERARKMLKN